MEKQLVPKLRFPEFEGKWEAKKLKNIADIKRGAGSQYINYVEKKEKTSIRLIRIGDFLSSDPVWIQRNDAIERFILKENDILIAGTGATAGITFKVPNDFIGMAFSYNAPKISCIKNVSSSFIVEYLKSTIITSQQKRLFTGNAQPFLDTKAINNFKINLPTLPEQQKIASFLTSVDKRIQALEQKKDLLKQYKKGVMQKIFKREIRFQPGIVSNHLPLAAEPTIEYGDNNSYPDWEVKKLNEVINYEQPTKYLVAKADYDDSFETPVLTAGKTFLLGYTNETKGIFKEKLPTIIFDDFTTAFQFVDFPFKAKSSAMKMLIPKNDKVNLKFVFEAMKTIKFPLAEHKRYWISEFSKEKIPYPCPEEQQKIAGFLSAIDAKIEAVTSQIDHSKTFKKGLLQKMFV